MKCAEVKWHMEYRGMGATSCFGRGVAVKIVCVKGVFGKLVLNNFLLNVA